MHWLFALLLALKSATVIDVQTDSRVTLVALHMGDVIYTAEFSRHELKAGNLIEGDHVPADVKDCKMRVRRKDGKIVSGRMIWEQRILVHPIP